MCQEGRGGAGGRQVKKNKGLVRMTSIHLLLSVVALSPPTGDIREIISLNRGLTSLFFLPAAPGRSQ